MNFKEYDRELASLFKKGNIAKALEAAASSSTTSSSLWKIVGNVKKSGKDRLGLTLSTASSSREGKSGSLTIESDIRPAISPNASLKMAITEQMRLKKFNASYESNLKYGHLLAVYFSLPKSVDIISSLSSASNHLTGTRLSHSNDTNAPKISPAAVVPTMKIALEVINFFLANSQITHSKSVGRIVFDTILRPPSMNTNSRGPAVSGGLFESIISCKISETAMVGARVEVSSFAEALWKEAYTKDYSSATMTCVANDNDYSTLPTDVHTVVNSEEKDKIITASTTTTTTTAGSKDEENVLMSDELALAFSPSRTMTSVGILSSACTTVDENNVTLGDEQGEEGQKERKKNDKTRKDKKKKDSKERVGCGNVAIELRARYRVPQRPGTNHCFSFVKKDTFCKPLPTRPQDGCQRDDAVHGATTPPFLACATSDGCEGANESYSEKTQEREKTPNGSLSVWRRTTTLTFTDIVASGRLLFSHPINPSPSHADGDTSPRMLVAFGLFGALKISVKERSSSSNSSLFNPNDHEMRANDERETEEGHRRGSKTDLLKRSFWGRREGKSLFRELCNDRTINVGARISCNFNTKNSFASPTPSSLPHPPARSPTFASLVNRISPHKHVDSLMKFTVAVDTPCFLKKKNTVRFGLESSISASSYSSTSSTHTKEGRDSCVDSRQRKGLLSFISSSLSAFAPALVFGYTYTNKGTVVDLTIDHRGKMGLYATFNSD